MSSVLKLQEFWETLKIQYVPAGRQLLTKVNNVKTSVEKLFRKKSRFVHSGSAVESLDFGRQAAYDNVLSQGHINRSACNRLTCLLFKR